MRILLVEDDPTTVKLAKAFLVQAEYDVAIANSVKSAISQLNDSTPFDLIISGLGMKGTDGFQFLKYLQSNPKFNKIPVLVVSAVHDKDSVVRCIELGAKDYMIKPIDQEVLLAKVQHVMEFRIKAVLIVDDDPLIRDLLKKIVEREGFKAILADGAEKALEVFDSNKIGLVISDIEMPGTNGMKLLESIKEKHPQVPVFLITSKSYKYDKDDVLEAGADGYITKPFKNFEITRRVAAALT